MQDKFKTKTGRLTAYAFACGYVEQTETEKRRIQLWHENGCFHVRAHDYDEHKRLFWECFDSMTKARKFYDANKSIVFA